MVFSGKGEPLIAEYIAKQDMCAFVLDYDIIGDDCRDACFVDGCHSNDLGFYRMAKAIGDELEVYLYKNAKK